LGHREKRGRVLSWRRDLQRSEICFRMKLNK
jgi:hypothetical protein